MQVGIVLLYIDGETSENISAVLPKDKENSFPL